MDVELPRVAWVVDDLQVVDRVVQSLVAFDGAKEGLARVAVKASAEDFVQESSGGHWLGAHVRGEVSGRLWVCGAEISKSSPFANHAPQLIDDNSLFNAIGEPVGRPREPTLLEEDTDDEGEKAKTDESADAGSGQVVSAIACSVSLVISRHEVGAEVSPEEDGSAQEEEP